MCLILFAYNIHPSYRLILAANRDEYHARPAAPLAPWPDPPILAGRDLEAGGTWLGIDPARKIAATLYQHSDHWGWSVEVGAGPWGEVEISDAGGAITDVSSLVVSTLNDLAYAQWAAARGISPGAMAGPGDDADGDGVTNLAEFAFDGDPSSPTRDGKTASTWQAAGSATYLVLTMPVRAGAVFSATPNGGRSAVRDGVSYRVEGGDGLVAFDAAVEEVIPALGGGLPALSVGWEYRSFRLAADTRTRPRGFLRVQAASAGP